MVSTLLLDDSWLVLREPPLGLGTISVEIERFKQHSKKNRLQFLFDVVVWQSIAIPWEMTRPLSISMLKEMSDGYLSGSPLKHCKGQLCNWDTPHFPLDVANSSCHVQDWKLSSVLVTHFSFLLNKAGDNWNPPDLSCDNRWAKSVAGAHFESLLSRSKLSVIILKRALRSLCVSCKQVKVEFKIKFPPPKMEGKNAIFTN